MPSNWTAEAADGRFDIDGLPGYVAGIPSYSLTAEASARRTIRGSIDVDTAFPDALRELGPIRWRFNRDFSLYHAQMHARRGNAVGTLGQVARAVFEEAHARCCAGATWVLNEKHLLTTAGLGDDVHQRFMLRAGATADLTRLVDDIRARLADGAASSSEATFTR